MDNEVTTTTNQGPDVSGYIVTLTQFTLIDYDIVIRRLKRSLEGQFKVIGYEGRKQPYYITIETPEGEWFKTHPMPGSVVIEQQCSHCMRANA